MPPSPYDTFTFYESEYHSRYVSFTPVEWATNQPGNDFFGLSPLQQLTPDQAHLVDTYNPFCQRGGFEAGGGCPVPFVDVGNRYIGFTGTDRSYINGMNWWQIASGLADPTVTSTKALDGASALLIGQICGVTENRPEAVCNDPVIQRYKLLDTEQS